MAGTGVGVGVEGEGEGEGDVRERDLEREAAVPQEPARPAKPGVRVVGIEWVSQMLLHPHPGDPYLDTWVGFQTHDMP
jgi:hypothetical protein